MITPLAGISYGVVTNHVTIKNLTTVVEDTSDRVGLAIKDMQRSLLSLACMVMDLALNFLLAKQEGVCTMANTFCCTYINTSGIVEERAITFSNSLSGSRSNLLKLRFLHRYGTK
jgi:hypothetical protein